MVFPPVPETEPTPQKTTFPSPLSKLVMPSAMEEIRVRAAFGPHEVFFDNQVHYQPAQLMPARPGSTLMITKVTVVNARPAGISHDIEVPHSLSMLIELGVASAPNPTDDPGPFGHVRESDAVVMDKITHVRARAFPLDYEIAPLPVILYHGQGRFVSLDKPLWLVEKVTVPFKPSGSIVVAPHELDVVVTALVLGDSVEAPLSPLGHQTPLTF